MYCWLSLTFLCYFGSILVRISADLQCHCSTDECLSEGKRTCTGKWCYSETFNGILESGCMDQWRDLLCENRFSSKLLSQSRISHCCNDKDYCNENIVPTPRPGRLDINKEKKEKEADQTHDNDYPPYLDSHAQHEADKSDCPCAVNEPRKNEGSMINPIYIAVPVAGVCVMLALIIFAMYLLRRRNDYFERYQYPRTVSVPQSSTSNTDHNKPVTSCKLNRCTDSERSSSGSETKLFL